MNVFGALIFGIIIFIIICTPILVLRIIAQWKVFKKAGKQGWEALIPFYSTWILNEISGLAWYWFLMAIAGTLVGASKVPGLSQLAFLVSLFARINIFYGLTKKFNKDVGFVVLLTLLPTVGLCIFAFSNEFQYDGNIYVSENGFINSSNNDNSSTQSNYSSVNNEEVKEEKKEDKKEEDKETKKTDDNKNEGESKKDKTTKKESSENKTSKTAKKNSDTSSSKKAEPTKFCHNCGAKLKSDQKFCNACGTKIN